MTVRTEPLQPRNFVSAILPWLAAVVALVVYLVTLNHWVSFSNLQTVVRLSGESWRPDAYEPLYFVLTYPIRWMPAKWVPLAINLFSALCAVLTLAQLARTVALLPHDRTYEQRQREKSIFTTLSIPQAWIPPVLAVAALGLQLTFWENATNGTSEMLDLLVFAYVIRCLLEYRLDEREAWLYRASLAYGLGLTSNWAMTGFLPVFIGALIWIRGLSFFDWRFLLRMALLALAGMLLYLLLPIIASDSAPVTFWQVLKANLAAPKNILAMFWRGVSKNILLALSVTSLLPILLISVRWPSQFGDSSRIGILIATWLFRLMHGALLGICVWTMLDPGFSPRGISGRFPFSFLSLYYLTAISIGYFVGYFLLVFRPAATRSYRSTPLNTTWAITLVKGGAWALLIGLPALLVFKNLPQIRMTNGPAMEQFADQLTRELPGRAVVLSDDERKLQIARAALVKTGRAGSYILVDTTSLRLPFYHAFLKKKYGADWPDLPRPDFRLVPDALVQRMIADLGQKHPVYYLHPSFGYYFEVFYAQPRGLVNELRLYPRETLLRPSLTPEEIAENQSFWQEIRQTALTPLTPLAHEPPPTQEPDLQARMRKLFKLPFTSNYTARQLAEFYSRSADAWGVELQRADRWDSAADTFDEALRLAPDNLSAEVNLEFNQRRRENRPVTPRPELNQEQFSTFERVLNRWGPLDEPNLCYEQGRRYAQNNLFRQSLQLFDRTIQLAPDHLRARLALAQLYIPFRRPEPALQLVREIRAHPGFPEESGVREADVVKVELTAHFSQTNTTAIREVIDDAIHKRIHDDNVMGALVQVCALFGNVSNAFEIIEHQLRAKTNNTGALANKGVLLSQLGRYDEALESLNLALRAQPNNYPVMMNRAITLVLAGRLDEAQKDYELLVHVAPKQHQIYYGLAEIAMRKQQTNTAIGYYEQYLTNAPPSRESYAVRERLQSLKSGSVNPSP